MGSVEGRWGCGDSARRGTNCVSEFGLSSRTGVSGSFSESDSGERDASEEALEEFSSSGEDTVSPVSDEAALGVEQETSRLSARGVEERRGLGLLSKEKRKG